MTVLIGIAVVIVCILTGYLMEHGNISVLVQPNEVIIIFGAMIGSFIISAPKELIIETGKALANLVNPANKNEEHYRELLVLLNELLTKITKEGILAIEQEILVKREQSPFFNKYQNILKNRRAVKFLCDSLAVIIDSEISADALETLLETEIETYRHEVMEVPHSVDKIADGLPGLGIVAAVLGVVVTMEKIDQPPKILGESIGAALLGTFLGVLMCYGFVGPMGTHLGHRAKKQVIYLDIIKVALVSFMKGMPTRTSIEFAKRVIPSHGQEQHQGKSKGKA